MWRLLLLLPEEQFDRVVWGELPPRAAVVRRSDSFSSGDDVISLSFLGSPDFCGHQLSEVCTSCLIWYTIKLTRTWKPWLVRVILVLLNCCFIHISNRSNVTWKYSYLTIDLTTTKQKHFTVGSQNLNLKKSKILQCAELPTCNLIFQIFVGKAERSKSVLQSWNVKLFGPSKIDFLEWSIK